MTVLAHTHGAILANVLWGSLAIGLMPQWHIMNHWRDQYRAWRKRKHEERSRW